MRLICALSPSPVRTACSTHFSLITGSMPGMPASTKLTCALGSAPNSVDAPENSLDLESTWAWTSMPITISHVAGRALDQFCGRVHQALHQVAGLRVERAPPFRASARLSTVASSNALPINCRPSGNPSAVSPAGHGNAGQARQVDRHGEDVVQIHRDRIVGLFARPPKAGPGVAGVSSTSHFSKASVKSRAISVRSFWARA